MVEINGFKGLRYSGSRDVSVMITQPYDKIDKGMQEEYYDRSPYNYVRVIFNKAQDPYEEAARTLREWIDRGVIKKDEREAIYPLEQEFTYRGETRVRHGFIAVFRIDENSVIKHEKTLSKPKEDRLKLLRATQCDTEPIFLLYDKSIKLDYTTKIAEGTEAGIKNSLYLMEDRAAIEAIKQKLSDEKVLIADGHHRYEVALQYLKEKGAGGPQEYKMAVFVNMSDPALVILPTHRLLYNVSDVNEKRLKDVFDVEELSAMREPEKHEFVMYDGKKAFSLRPKNYEFDEKEHSKEYWMLDTAMFQKLVIEEVFGIRDIEEHVRYVREIDAGRKMVEKGECRFLFLLHPTGIDEVRKVSSQGEVMPQKSTDFYPKLPSGMVAYDLG
jgi:uncharacterized protein (DUF1015 family)